MNETTNEAAAGSEGGELAAGDVAVAGVALGAACAGLKPSGRPDIAVLHLDAGTCTAALFTRNAFCAAPVHVARAHLQQGEPGFLLINSGCANAGTGDAGEADARAACAHLAEIAGVDAAAVLPFSTGVIGPRLPLDKLHGGIDACMADLAADHWPAAAEAIMTTDTRRKLATRSVRLADGEVRITGMAKGAGMVRPDMATLLAFVATDAAIGREDLDRLLRRAVDRSLHCITIDGDTSTNDAVTLSATGASGVGLTAGGDEAAFAAALDELFVDLATGIIRDAEGATHLIEICVTGGEDVQACREVAFTVAHSPLVKTAVFGGDPNWGRILAAVGRAPINNLDVAGVDIRLGDIELVAGGQPVAGYDEERAAAVMAQDHVVITIGLGRGEAAATVWTSDLSHDYVRINADYRT